MTAPTIDTIAGLLVDNFDLDPARVTPDATFRRTLGLDSLDVVDFVFFVHEAFGFEAPLHDYRSIETVGQLVTFIESRRLAA